MRYLMRGEAMEASIKYEVLSISVTLRITFALNTWTHFDRLQNGHIVCIKILL